MLRTALSRVCTSREASIHQIHSEAVISPIRELRKTAIEGEGSREHYSIPSDKTCARGSNWLEILVWRYASRHLTKILVRAQRGGIKIFSNCAQSPCRAVCFTRLLFHMILLICHFVFYRSRNASATCPAYSRCHRFLQNMYSLAYMLNTLLLRLYPSLPTHLKLSSTDE